MITDPHLKNMLRFGLPTKRTKEIVLEELRENVPLSRQRTMVEVALKDPSTSYDDVEEVISGEHYKRYLEENVKLQTAASSVLQEFSGDLRDFFGDTEGNEPKKEIENEEDSASKKIPIVDTTGFEEKCFIDVDMSDVLEYRRTGDHFDGDVNSDLPSSKRAISALNALDKMSKVDQDDFFRSINNAFDAAVQHKRHLVSKNNFVEELNRQLSYEERVRFITLVLKRSKDVLTNNK